MKSSFVTDHLSVLWRRFGLAQALPLDGNRQNSRGHQMKCQRCWSDQEPVYRVYTDALNIKVCATCAKEALGLGIAVEVLGGGKGKANGEQDEFGLQDRRPELLTYCR
jgi:hypothetical protein